MMTKYPNTKLPRILIVSSNHELRAVLRHVLQRSAYQVEECSSQCTLRHSLGGLPEASAWNRFDAIFFDTCLLEGDVVHLIRNFSERERSPPLIMVTGWQGTRRANPADGLATVVIQSPADLARYTTLIRQWVPHRQSD
ncbi:MAG: hypothetical protein CL681_16870 [Blastopirellula sp.]|nr:hypothetical protein [Blastopirellula sp.]